MDTGCVAFDRERAAPLVALQDPHRCQRGRLHSGCRCQLLEQRPRELLRLFRRVAASRRVHLEGEQLRRLDADVHPRQVVQRADEEPGARSAAAATARPARLPVPCEDGDARQPLIRIRPSASTRPRRSWSATPAPGRRSGWSTADTAIENAKMRPSGKVEIGGGASARHEETQHQRRADQRHSETRQSAGGAEQPGSRLATAGPAASGRAPSARRSAISR